MTFNFTLELHVVHGLIDKTCFLMVSDLSISYVNYFENSSLEDSLELDREFKMMM